MLEGRQTIDSYEENQEKNNNDVDMSELKIGTDAEGTNETKISSEPLNEVISSRNSKVHSPTQKMDKQSRPSSPVPLRLQDERQKDDFYSDDSRDENTSSRDTVLHIGKF
ncbi:hypothetical protein Phum_PHUM045050 [Pediculus humanus corporis]|uniref:Uncharacterized protein n=1 Tax=Pediculus humanus subsp. corporis TaxID=121224 RepID=E0VAU9_PEDHC|nr:uncharacterized protein Phum_PHUM045050 [Pediculus humanus corporis]EEB10505.1 hypothetical protein Phum_PHUM045050 [Pediculus humanus corporis]